MRPGSRRRLVADYTLGPDIIIKFTTAMKDDDNIYGLWLPDDQVVLIDAALGGRDLAHTLLHEVGHMLCGDHDAVLTGAQHDLLDEWAASSANLLDLVRPGRRAAIAPVIARR